MIVPYASVFGKTGREFLHNWKQHLKLQIKLCNRDKDWNCKTEMLKEHFYAKV